jgi:hypothetical protein
MASLTAKPDFSPGHQEFADLRSHMTSVKVDGDTNTEFAFHHDKLTVDDIKPLDFPRSDFII